MVLEMSSAFTAITETDGQLKLKPVEPQVKAKLGRELYALLLHTTLMFVEYCWVVCGFLSHGTLSAFLSTHPL